MVKSAEELALIRRSVETNSRAFEQTVARVKPGIRENDLAAELEYRMRRLGAEKAELRDHCGRRSALGAAACAAHRRAAGAGDLVVVDMGAFQDGYASDMTRMLSVGAPAATVKRMYRAVLEAQLAAIDAVRAGVTTVQRGCGGAPGAGGLWPGPRVHPLHGTRPGPRDPRTAAVG